MHKIAVTVDDLRRAAAASKRNVHIRRFSRKDFAQLEASLPQLLEAEHGVDPDTANEIARKTRDMFTAGAAINQRTRGAISPGLPVTEPGRYYVKSRGMGDAVRIIPTLTGQGGYPRISNPAAREIIGRTVHLHEAKEVEQALREGIKTPFLSHAGHRPWANDVVIARTIQGPGASQARDFIEHMRSDELGLIQSSPNISDKVKAQFASGRPNRHSIKHVQKAWDADTAMYSDAPTRVNLPKTNLPGEARADFAAARAAQPGLTRKQFLESARTSAPIKLAGVYDEAAMRELGKKVRPGDVLSWEVPPADVYKKGPLAGVQADAVSGSIRAVTGSPVSHTALIHSIDPDTGIPNIIHNYEGNKRVTIESLRRYADTNVMHVARPNISEDRAAEAVQRAVTAMERGVAYPKRDLALMLPGQAAKHVGLEGVARQANRVGSAIAKITGGRRHCDPATGVCSSFVAHALAPAFGSQESAMRALGGVGGGRLGITPADIFNASRNPTNTAINEIASYRPRDQEVGRLSGALHGVIDRLKKVR